MNEPEGCLGKEPTIAWREVARGRDGLRIYRIEAEAQGLRMGSGANASPLDLFLSRFANPTVRAICDDFSESSPAVGPSSLQVACHVISLPDILLVADATYRTTAPRIFPAVLEEIVRSEGCRLEDRPLLILYTHAHFDHAGGHETIEALDGSVCTLAHPFTGALIPYVSRVEAFFRSRGQFFRDCGVTVDLEPVREELQELYHRLLRDSGLGPAESQPWGDDDQGTLRVDVPIDPGEGTELLAEGRIEVLRFDGHIPGHLCLRVDRDHLITGDMWLPATTSTVTPGTVAELAGVPADRCGISRYIESTSRLLDLDVEKTISYPSHETIYRNPKRMAMRDLELFAERFELVYEVLSEHRRKSLRVLDLAWGGERKLPVWKVERSKYRLLIAHDEARAYVQDLVRVGDLAKVEDERFIWTGRTRLGDELQAELARARERYGHLEFRSRGAD